MFGSNGLTPQRDPSHGEADAVVKLYSAGLLPASYALAKLGYSDDEVAEIRAARRAEALDSVGVNLRALPTTTGEPA